MEIERLISEIKNYRLDNIVGLADVFLLCLGIFLGTGRDIFPESSLAYALLGMILWRYAVLCLGTACSIVQREIRLGTLEQLMMARYPLMEVVVIRLLAASLLWLAVGALSFSRAMGRAMACGTTAQY